MSDLVFRPRLTDGEIVFCAGTTKGAQLSFKQGQTGSPIWLATRLN